MSGLLSQQESLKRIQRENVVKFFKSVTRPGNKMPIALIIVITQLTFYIIKLSALWII